MAPTGPLLYVQLIGFTAGTVLFLFLLILFLGYRRRRALERVLFFLMLALFLVYSGALLKLNAELYYGDGGSLAGRLAFGLWVTGITLLPPLLVDAHATYARLRGWARSPQLLRGVAFLFYAPLVLLIPLLLPEPFLAWYERAVPLVEEFSTSTGFWLCAALGVAGAMQFGFRGGAYGSERQLHQFLGVLFLGAAALGVYSFLLDAPGAPPAWAEAVDTVLYLAPVVAGAVLSYHVLRHNFLAIAVHRHLIYVVTGGFLAVLFLTVVERISRLLEPVLPPVATTSILVFVLVFLFEPLQRAVRRLLARTVQAEVGRLQRLAAELDELARSGNMELLVTFAEERIRDEFSLAYARLSLRSGPERPAATSGNVQRFPLRREGREMGALEAYHYGPMLAGETQAALEALAEQLPAALDLCRLIEEKVKLERELAERERLALLGQMAASISHNLKNPLGSMKTLLQVQLERPDLPEPVRHDAELVVAEIDRMSAKLQQLLQYSRPPLRAGVSGATSDAAALAAQSVELLGREAERRGIRLSLEGANQPLAVCGTPDAVSDVLQNLVVNAAEASPPGGAVRIRLELRDAVCRVSVTDEGPGIPADLRERVFQPFYTSKPSGTGLGLAIVERRLAELGGSITFQSPVADGHGTRFTVTLPLAASREGKAG